MSCPALVDAHRAFCSSAPLNTPYSGGADLGCVAPLFRLYPRPSSGKGQHNSSFLRAEHTGRPHPARAAVLLHPSNSTECARWWRPAGTAPCLLRRFEVTETSECRAALLTSMVLVQKCDTHN